MNKKSFIEELAKTLNYEEEKCEVINSILENNFVISKKSKDPIINELVSKLDIDFEEAERIYEVATSVIKSEVKESLKHPFRNKDK